MYTCIVTPFKYICILIVLIIPFLHLVTILHTLIGSSDGKEPAYNAGNPASIPWLGRSPGEKNGNPLQYACLENPMERGPGTQQYIRSQRVRHNCTT